MSKKNNAFAAQWLVYEKAREQEDHLSLVGAVIGDWYVKARVKPAKRVVYVCWNKRTGKTKGFTGNELVVMIRAARTNGLPVIMPTTPWVDVEPIDPNEDAA